MINYYRNNDRNPAQTSNKKGSFYSFSSQKKAKGHIKDIDQYMIVQNQQNQNSKNTMNIKQTPRINKNKSLSTINYYNATPTTDLYLQLQLDTSAKKRQTNEKLLVQKQKRIKTLEQQIIENQLLVKETVHKWKRYIQQEQAKRLQQSLQKQKTLQISKSKIEMLETQLQSKNKQCQVFKQKIGKLQDQNNKLKAQAALAAESLKKQKHFNEQLKQKRKQQKMQYKVNLMQMINQINTLKQQIYQTNESDSQTEKHNQPKKSQ